MIRVAALLPLALMATLAVAAALAASLDHTDPEELQAVYDIMSATGNGWASRIPDVCKGRWHGIECSPADAQHRRHVTSLSFGVLSEDTAFPACTSPAASVSPAIARLPHLRRLFFYKCCAANPQPIPADAIASLGGSLEVLVLRQNGHVGTIPDVLLSNLTRLHTLDLQGNSLSSAIPSSIGLLQNLVLLDLSHNQLSHKLPSSLSHLTCLRVLDLSFNELHGPLLDSTLSTLTNLNKVDLSHNNLIGPLPSVAFPHLNTLVLLDLSFNSFHGPLPPHLGHLHSLRALILDSAGQLESAIPITFRHLSQLEVLVMTSVGLVGEIPDIFYGTHKLKIVRMDHNKLTGLVPKSLGRLEELSELRLSNNELIGTLPFSHELLWHLNGRLDVNNNSGLCIHDPFDHSLALQGIHHCNNSIGSLLLVEKAKGLPSPTISNRRPSSQGNPFSSSRPLLHMSTTHRHNMPIWATLRLLFLCGLTFLVGSK